MRGVVVMCALAGCGRFGFADRSPADARRADAAADAAIDGTPLPAGLIAWWPMDDDPTDGTIDDIGGGGHDAQCATGVSCPTSVAGKHGNALHVDGTQYALVPYGAWLGTSGPFTYSAWIYIEQDIDQVAFARPVGANVGDSWDIVTWSVASGTGTCLEDADGTGANQAVCGAHSPTNQWIHVAGRWDGTTSSLFINGALAGSKAMATVMFDASNLVFGSDENTGAPAYQFHGRIDDLQLYNRALTATEIAVLAQ